MRSLVVIAALGCCALLAAQGQVLLTTEEALELAFPDCQVERTMQTLDDAVRKRVEELCGEAPERALVYPYRATRNGEPVGTAYFDVHRVRTLRETLMVVVRPDGTLDRVELLAFGEPKEYAPRDVFYAQFAGCALDEGLNLKRGIRGITGATLSARATVDCARRALAIHRALQEAREQAEREQTPARDPSGDPPRDLPPERPDPDPESNRPAPEPPVPPPVPAPAPTPKPAVEPR